MPVDVNIISSSSLTYATLGSHERRAHFSGKCDWNERPANRVWNGLIMLLTKIRDVVKHNQQVSKRNDFELRRSQTWKQKKTRLWNHIARKPYCFCRVRARNSEIWYCRWELRYKFIAYKVIAYFCVTWRRVTLIKRERIYYTFIFFLP